MIPNISFGNIDTNKNMEVSLGQGTVNGQISNIEKEDRINREERLLRD